MVVVGSVREVKAGDVHAGPEKLLDHRDGARSGAKSADDLGLGPPLGRGGSSNGLAVHVVN